MQSAMQATRKDKFGRTIKRGIHHSVKRAIRNKYHFIHKKLEEENEKRDKVMRNLELGVGV